MLYMWLVHRAAVLQIVSLCMATGFTSCMNECTYSHSKEDSAGEVRHVQLITCTRTQQSAYIIDCGLVCRKRT